MSPPRPLTARQLEVAYYVRSHWTDKRIAAKLAIGEHYVRTVISSIVDALDLDRTLNRRTQITEYVIRHEAPLTNRD